jgi:hypothetical protein
MLAPYADGAARRLGLGSSEERRFVDVVEDLETLVVPPDLPDEE